MLKDYVQPKTVDGVLASLRQGNARIIAGGTDLMLDMKAGKTEVEKLVDINCVDSLKKIEIVDGSIIIGAAVTHQEVATSKLIQEKAPVLAKACRTVGSLQIRNTGTMVGNVINAQPAADAAVALIALGAVAEIFDENGISYLPVEELYLGVGQSKIDSSKQLVTSIKFPSLQSGQGSAFVRLAQRGALALPMLNVSVVVTLSGDKVDWLRLVMAPVAPKPVRATEAEKMIQGKQVNEETIIATANAVASQANPRDSALRGSGEYRKSVLQTLVKRGLIEAFAEAQK
ncbi:MAG: xanthine dehydrogenase family protein subunit M [Firmicutes bacterium]|nr:xanthine dehydrogenase family protein subunit M [Bacillota bacterium]